MIIKNYLVNDMYEAMVVIKQELGSEAVIVSKRLVRQKGLGGLFKKKMIEVTAAVDHSVSSSTGIVKKTETVPREDKARLMAQNAANSANEELKSEVQQIKDLVMTLMEKSDQNNGKENLNIIKQLMVDMDFNSLVIADFEQYCKDHSIEAERINKNVLVDFVYDRFTNKIKTMDVGGRIRTFIGPTGVGKTTTIAKLASNESLVNHKNIGLITIDTYRIGAVEQLKIYANILDIPIKVVFAPEDLPEAIEQFNDKDLIFIDSTGRSHKNIHQLNELKTYFDQCENMKTYLVLSMVTKNVDFIKTIQNYKKVCFDSLILTKVDETYSFGNILNTGYYTDKPISYICKGQVVPNDIEKATKETLIKYIWGETKI